MVYSLNRVTLIGNLGRDPEPSKSQSPARFVTLSIATSESWKDRTTGERKDRTEWHRVVIFNPYLIERCERLLKKGSKVFVEGTLQSRTFINPETNVEQRTHEICIRYKGDVILLDGIKGGEGGYAGASQGYGDEEGGGGSTSGEDASGPPLTDDEIPF